MLFVILLEAPGCHSRHRKAGQPAAHFMAQHFPRPGVGTDGAHPVLWLLGKVCGCESSQGSWHVKFRGSQTDSCPFIWKPSCIPGNCRRRDSFMHSYTMGKHGCPVELVIGSEISHMKSRDKRTHTHTYCSNSSWNTFARAISMITYDNHHL